jgi:hypothetical protein
MPLECAAYVVDQERRENLGGSLRKDGNFKFLWKLTLPNEPRQLNALTQPVLLDRLIRTAGT